MGILEYADKIREAVGKGDKERLEAVVRDYGGQQATFKDLEELNAKTISIIASMITQETMLNSYKLDLITTTLIEKKVISGEDVEELNKSLEELLEYIQGE